MAYEPVENTMIMAYTTDRRYPYPSFFLLPERLPFSLPKLQSQLKIAYLPDLTIRRTAEAKVT